MKFFPRRLIKAHYGTFVHARTGKRLVGDYVIALLVPLAAGVLVLGLRLNVDTTVSGGVLTASGLFAAFLFGAMLQVSARALEWIDSNPDRGAATSKTARSLEELAANAGYSSLMAVLAAVAFLMCSAFQEGWPNTIALAAGVAIGLHMIIGLIMVMNRVFLMTQRQLILARTGSPVSIVEIDPEQRTGS